MGLFPPTAAGNSVPAGEVAMSDTADKVKKIVVEHLGVEKPR
jgi:hypothetical protein